MATIGWTRRQWLAGAGANVVAPVIPCARAAAEPCEEPVLWPDLPIVDPHHHLWKRLPNGARYLVPELRADLDSGHTIVGTVFVECQSNYRTDGPEELRPVGEVEFVLAQTDGDRRIARGIVAHADLGRGDAVAGVLEALIDAGGGRVRGIRQSTPYDAAPVFGTALPPDYRDMALQPAFRAGFAHLGRFGLSFDAWCLHRNIPDITSLARAFPGTEIVLDHIGTPVGVGPYAGKSADVFAVWRRHMAALAECPNVSVKFGGLGMAVLGAPTFVDGGKRSSATHAALWRPWFESCVALFGTDRIMFESNFPVDAANCDYRTLWNAMKHLAIGASIDERADLFERTATRFYRL